MKTFCHGQKLKRNLQRDPKQAFISGKQSAPIRSYRLAARATPLDDLASRQHRFKAQHMVRGHTIFQAMGAARVKRDVAANRAYRLARGIRSIVQTMRSRGG